MPLQTDLQTTKYKKIQNVNGFQPLTIFAKKCPSWMFDWVLNTSLISFLPDTRPKSTQIGNSTQT